MPNISGRCAQRQTVNVHSRTEIFSQDYSGYTEREYEYSGTVYTTCPVVGNHRSGLVETTAPQAEPLNAFLYNVSMHLMV